jgi:hypothetical protein
LIRLLVQKIAVVDKYLSQIGCGNINEPETIPMRPGTGPANSGYSADFEIIGGIIF